MKMEQYIGKVILVLAIATTILSAFVPTPYEEEAIKADRTTPFGSPVPRGLPLPFAEVKPSYNEDLSYVYNIVAVTPDSVLAAIWTFPADVLVFFVIYSLCGRVVVWIHANWKKLEEVNV